MYYTRRANKYGAKKTEFNGRVYDSKHEAGVAADINLLLKSGDVVKVEAQRTFNLYGKNGNRICTHRPDFVLTFKDGHQEVWEAKGMATSTWQLKLKLFVDNYPELTYHVITPRESFYYGSNLKRNNQRSFGKRAA
jgi:hypothetical protein